MIKITQELGRNSKNIRMIHFPHNIEHGGHWRWHKETHDLPPHYYREMVVQRKLLKEILLCYFFTFNVNNPIPHLNTRRCSNSGIQETNYDLEGGARMAGTIILLQIVLEARKKRQSPYICLRLRVQKEWKKWITSYLSLLSRVQKGIDLRSVFKLRPSPFHTKRKERKSKIANSLKLSEKVEEYHNANKDGRLTSTVLPEML